jgi:hypothetical protein
MTVAPTQRDPDRGPEEESTRPLFAGAADRAPGALLIPEYTLLRKLAEGGFGEVWLAQNAVGAYRAVKVLKTIAGEAELEFEGLKVYMRALRQHPHLIHIHHVGEAGGKVYYVMDLADAYKMHGPVVDPASYEPRTVAGDLKRRGCYEVEEAAEIVLDVLSGLNYLHEHDLLHRDIKPANIVFVDERPQLTDIGLVMKASGSKVRAMTPAYAPKEGVEDRSGDLYCLAKTLFEMVTGTHPKFMPKFPSSADSERQAAFVRLCPLLVKACHDDPRQRFQRCEDFEDHLRRAVPGAGGTGTRTATGTETDTRRDTRPKGPSLREKLKYWLVGHARAVAVALFLVALVGCALLLYHIFYEPPVEPPVVVVAGKPQELADRALEADRRGDRGMAALCFANVAFAESSQPGSTAGMLNRRRAVGWALSLPVPVHVEEFGGSFDEKLAEVVEVGRKSGSEPGDPGAELRGLFDRLNVPGEAVLSPDGRECVSVHGRPGGGGFVCRWRLPGKRGVLRAKPFAAQNEAIGFAVSPGGGRYFLPYTWGGGQTLESTRRYDGLSGEAAGAVLADGAEKSPNGNINSASLSPDGKTAAVLLTKLPGKSSNPNMRYEVAVVDAERGVDLGRFALKAEPLDAGFSADGALLAVVTRDGRLFVFVVLVAPTPELKPAELPEHSVRPASEKMPAGLEFGPKGAARRLATFGFGDTVALWDLTSPGASAGQGIPPSWRLVHGRPVTKAVFTPDANRLATLDEDGKLRVFDLRTRPERPEFTFAGEEPITHFVLTPSGDRVLLATSSGGVALRQLGDGPRALWPDPNKPASTSKTPVQALAVSPDGRWAFIGGTDGRLRVLDIGSGHDVAPPLDLGFKDKLSLAVFQDSQGALLRVVAAAKSNEILWLDFGFLAAAEKVSPDGVVYLAGVVSGYWLDKNGTAAPLADRKWFAAWEHLRQHHGSLLDAAAAGR